MTYAAKLVVKSFIEYNSNNLEENEEEKEAIHKDFTKSKSDPENYENTIDFKWSNVQGKDLAIAKLIEIL